MRYHMRRKDKELTEPQHIKKILESAEYVTIAMSMNEQPYLVSLSHGYNEKRKCIYFHCSNHGKKIEYLKSNNKVWGQALLDYKFTESKGDCSHQYASVHFSGKVVFIENPEEKRLAINSMIRKLSSDPEKIIDEISYKRLEKTTIGRIELEYLTGKKSNK